MALFVVLLAGQALSAGVEAVRGLTFSRPVATVAAGPARPDARLQATLAEVAAGPTSHGIVAMVAHELQSGSYAAVRADQPMRAASLFKIPILVEVLKQQRLNRLSADELLEVRQEHWSDGSGVLQARVGDRLTVRELVRLMIQDSDNIAALVLLDEVGVQNVNATMQAMGLRVTRLRDRAVDPVGDHLTTAGEMAALLGTIATGTLIDAATSEQAVEYLELRQAQSWLAEGLPWWVKVAHKWGDLPGARHDAGIVYAPGSTTVLVVLTEGATQEQGRAAIVQASKAVYETLRR